MKDEFIHKIKILHLDQDVVVVDKPSGLTTIHHPHEVRKFGNKSRFLPKTLSQYLPQIISKKDRKKRRRGTPPPVKAVHRLDKETSGLLVFARNAKAASHLGKQFKEHSVKRKYTALVRGDVYPGNIESKLARDRGDGIRGSHPKTGKLAITNIVGSKPVGQYSLIECALKTGRTHQIRIHLAEIGHPVCGEKIYHRRFKKKKIKDLSDAPRLALHAATLGFRHPKTGKFLSFHSPLPQDLSSFIKRLRQEEK